MRLWIQLPVYTWKKGEAPPQIADAINSLPGVVSSVSVSTWESGREVSALALVCLEGEEAKLRSASARLEENPVELLNRIRKMAEAPSYS